MKETREVHQDQETTWDPARSQSCQPPHPFESLKKKEDCYCLDPYHTPQPDYITSPYSPGASQVALVVKNLAVQGI